MSETHTLPQRNEALRQALGITAERQHRSMNFLGGAIEGATPDVIRRLRLSLGLTQGQFAEALGMPRHFKTNVSHWERGHLLPRHRNVYSRRLVTMLEKARELGVLPSASLSPSSMGQEAQS